VVGSSGHFEAPPHPACLKAPITFSPRSRWGEGVFIILLQLPPQSGQEYSSSALAPLGERMAVGRVRGAVASEANAPLNLGEFLRVRNAAPSQQSGHPHEVIRVSF
jgi:hypothetical protein